ncbi:PREDICTED: kinesin-related protein 4-like [Wasmannia auropunctata]|uniref:kinesin-related protein 4-like n=1 Tax=Wasmannia auropunctata TaxID=64793 RepID=UPI0005EF728B|nr:PREDICTED: kinesin-related protein 4-like [Wasmannia auropunctata]XP_011700186.1 PREDICTED: kinesin-related protein 4-like [Wasmannia auropunctata]
MEKFMIDLDKVLNDFEFNEDCAEQIASVTTSTVDASSVEKHTNESVPPKMYNFNPEKDITIDVASSAEKCRDIRPIDVDSSYSLTEKNMVFISDSKDSVNNFYTRDRINDITTGQKSCVYTYDSDQVSSTMYSDISQNSILKQQHANDSKDSDRYDKKLNQPNFKPSISNVFNSLNEYINAPTGSLSYVEPMLDKADDLSERSADDIVEKDFRSSRDIAINECSISMEKGIMNVIDKNILDHKNILPTELGTFAKVEISNKQDNTVQNIMFHPPPIQSEESNSNPVISVPSTAISKHNNVTTDAKLFSNKGDVDKKIMINDTLKKNSDSIIIKQKHLDLDQRDSIDKYTFVENKESIAETTKLDQSITSSEIHDKNVETTKNNIFSNVRMIHTIDTSDDFSEEELNQYLLELEKEERSKTENVSLSDNTWLSQSYDESRSDKEKNASHCQRDDENVNDVLIFEKFMIGELPKISQEEFQEKTKTFPVIDYNVDICNENVTDVKCNNTVKVDLNEKSNQLRDTQNNELDKTITDNHVTDGQDVAIQENILQTIPDIAVQDKVTSKFENTGEQLYSNNMIQTLQQDSNSDTLSQDNSDALLNLSENKEDQDKRVYCEDITENNKDVFVVHEPRTHDNEKISKVEIVSKASDTHTKENQEIEKPTRPQTLDIVLTHDKNDSHTFGMLL